MKKLTLFAAFALFLCSSNAALAISPPIIPSQTIPQAVPVTPIVNPIIKPNLVIDPILIPSLSTTSDSGATTIDPDLLKNLKPIPLPSITIPPELIKGPRILDTQFSTDGNLLKINWTTDKEATSKVEYGTTDAYGKTLEDTTLTTDHQMVIPAAPGTMHLKLSSSNSLKQTTESDDIALAIPEATPEAMDEPAAAITEDENTSKPELYADPVVTPAPTDQVTETTSIGITTTNAVLGGAIILLIGLIVGFAVRGKKKQHDDSVV